MTDPTPLPFHLDDGIIRASDGTWCYPANGTEKDLFAALAVSAADNAALRADFQALQHALVGNTGASAILTAGALRKRVEELTETLRFVERWAVHHGTKPHMTAEEALSCIQHYPAIRAITRSYADGKEPKTPNPWKRVEELEAALRAIDAECFSHVDGRDLFAQLHPRNMLDIKRRVDARETWFEGDWLTDLWRAIKASRALLSQPKEPK